MAPPDKIRHKGQIYVLAEDATDTALKARTQLRQMEDDLPRAEADLPSEDQIMDYPEKHGKIVFKKLKEIEKIYAMIKAYNK